MLQAHTNVLACRILLSTSCGIFSGFCNRGQRLRQPLCHIHVCPIACVNIQEQAVHRCDVAPSSLLRSTLRDQSCLFSKIVYTSGPNLFHIRKMFTLLGPNFFHIRNMFTLLGPNLISFENCLHFWDKHCSFSKSLYTFGSQFVHFRKLYTLVGSNMFIFENCYTSRVQHCSFSKFVYISGIPDCHFLKKSTPQMNSEQEINSSHWKKSTRT